MRRIFVFACLLTCLSASAQHEHTKTENNSFLKQFTFQSINQVGIMEGQKGTSFQLQTINGLSKNNWFAGFGAGIDYYHLRTIPVFIDVRKNILKKDRSPFVYADGGISFPWGKEGNNNQWFKDEYKNGMFYDVGLGFNQPVGKAGTVVLSIGYSEKKLTEERYSYNYYVLPGIYEEITNKTEYNYRLRRISIKAGWRF